MKEIPELVGPCDGEPGTLPEMPEVEDDGMVWTMDEVRRHSAVSLASSFTMGPTDLYIEDFYELIGVIEVFLRTGVLPESKEVQAKLVSLNKRLPVREGPPCKS